MTTAVANRGRMLRPTLIDRVVDGDEVIRTRQTEERGRIDLDEELWQNIHLGMRDVVEHPAGTGAHLGIPFLSYGAKTGTAQVARQTIADLRRLSTLPRELQDHAWFTAFAPYDDPEVVVTVIVEHGGGGGASAGPVAKQLLEYYFADRIAEAREEWLSRRWRRRRPAGGAAP